MKFTIVATIRSLFSLVSFMFWYLLVVGAVFFVLPEAAMFLQAQYEGLQVMTRLIIGLALLVATLAGVIHALRSRGTTDLPARLEHHSRH
ncbi:MAG TPA: hypothetical protein VJN01_09680 [Xanthomonadales bacterium]|nr:hypothetical protein [Xanthomonadales bacterium]